MSTKRKPTLPDVQFVVMKLADLRPAAYNPRTISDDAMAGLEASITRFGLVQCPVFNRRSGTLVGGHQRVKVLEKAGMTETMTAVVDVDETSEKALNLTLNNPAIAGEFNERLADLLGIIQAEDEKLFGELRLDVLLPAEPDKPEDEWQGMPEFEQEDQGPWKTVHVHFRGKEDLDAFAALVGQAMTEKTKFVWYPKAEIGVYRDKGYVDEP